MLGGKAIGRGWCFLRRTEHFNAKLLLLENKHVFVTRWSATRAPALAAWVAVTDHQSCV